MYHCTSSPMSSPPSSPLSSPPAWLMLPESNVPHLSLSTSNLPNGNSNTNLSYSRSNILAMPILGSRRVVTYGKKRSVRPVILSTSADLSHFRGQPKRVVENNGNEDNSVIGTINQVNEITERVEKVEETLETYYKEEVVENRLKREAVEDQLEEEVVENQLQEKVVENQLGEEVIENQPEEEILDNQLEEQIHGQPGALAAVERVKQIHKKVKYNVPNQAQLDQTTNSTLLSTDVKISETQGNKLRGLRQTSKAETKPKHTDEHLPLPLPDIPSSPPSASSLRPTTKRVKFSQPSNPSTIPQPQKRSPTPLSQLHPTSSPPLPSQCSLILSSFETAAWDFLAETDSFHDLDSNQRVNSKAGNRSRAKLLHSWSSQLDIAAPDCDDNDVLTDDDNDDFGKESSQMSSHPNPAISDEESDYERASEKIHHITVPRTTITSTLKRTYGSVSKRYLPENTASDNIGGDNFDNENSLGFGFGLGSSSPTKAARDLTDADLDAIFGAFDKNEIHSSHREQNYDGSSSGDENEDNSQGIRDNKGDNGVKTIHDLRHAGRQAQFDDDAQYLLDGLAGSSHIGKTRWSALMDFGLQVLDNGFLGHFTLPKSTYLKNFLELTMNSSTITTIISDTDGVGRFLTGLIILKIVMSPYSHHLTSLLTLPSQSLPYHLIPFLAALLQDTEDIRTIAETSSMAKRSQGFLNDVLAKFDLILDDGGSHRLNGEMLALTILTAMIDVDTRTDELLRSQWCLLSRSVVEMNSKWPDVAEPLVIVALKSFETCAVASVSSSLAEDWQRLHMVILLLEFMATSASFLTRLFCSPSSISLLFKHAQELLGRRPIIGSDEENTARDRLLAPLLRLLILLTARNDDQTAGIDVDIELLVVTLVGLLVRKYTSDADTCLFSLGLLVNILDRITDMASSSMVIVAQDLKKLFMTTSASIAVGDNSSHVCGYLGLALSSFLRDRPQLLDSAEAELVNASLVELRGSLGGSSDKNNENSSNGNEEVYGLKDRINLALKDMLY